MMYDGALKFLKQAQAGLEANDVAKFCRFLCKAQAIISELMNTLDFEKGGDIARDLDRLYDFMLFYLTEANLYRDAERVSKVITLLNSVYSAYREVILDRPQLEAEGKEGEEGKTESKLGVSL